MLCRPPDYLLDDRIMQARWEEERSVLGQEQMLTGRLVGASNDVPVPDLEESDDVSHGNISLWTIRRSQIDDVQISSALLLGGGPHLKIVFTHLPDHLVHEVDEQRVFVEADR